MLLALLSLIPVGLGLFLLAFGVPGRPLLQPTPRNLAAVGGAAFLLGPVALMTLGVAGWLALMGVTIVAVVLATGLRNPPRRRPLPE
ncbi:MAG TPA: hypothetical protein VF533_16505 [Solirubrobacteraceae bacterium]|jgi:hypothetical protein